EATRLRGEQSEELLDLRMQCLDERRRALVALTRTLEKPDALVVKNALSAVGALPALEGCADAAGLRGRALPPSDPARRAQWEALAERLGEVRALEGAGKWKEAIALAKPLAAEVAEVGHAPLEAEALLWLGKLQQLTGAYSDSEATLHRAAQTAQAGRDDALAAQAWTELITTVGLDRAKPEPALLWDRYAQAALSRIAEPNDLDARRRRSLGYLYVCTGRFSEARQELAASVTQLERSLGERHLATADAMGWLSVALQRSGALTDSLAMSTRSLQVLEGLLGREHPTVASARTNRATTLKEMGRCTEAAAECAIALPVLEREVGSESLAMVNHRLICANALVCEGRYGEAMQVLERMLTQVEKSGKPGAICSVLNNLGDLWLRQGQLSDAKTVFERAFDVVEKELPPEHPLQSIVRVNLAEIALRQEKAQRALELLEAAPSLRTTNVSRELPYVLVRLGRAKAALGRGKEALLDLERSVALFQAEPREVPELYAARLALARVLDQTRTDAARAATLAATAREGCARLGAPCAETLAQIDGWLALHPPPR
ncbi:MAG: tetratricopeptide repeat protein, partial [Deltaproteobacteria bacterium]|nr:tetratricopeptide repeat protein [Deltaproteobacteria bacterium]